MHTLNPNDVRFFSGSSHPELAKAIASYLTLPLEPTSITRFSNDNLYIQLGASVRGRSVYLVQSLTHPVSEHLMELLMMIDIARSAGAAQIHAIIPYFSYARSDKKDAPRISITARLVADLLQTAGATHVMTMTLHSPQVHGFFSIPTDPLTARHLFMHHFCEKGYPDADTIVVSPDMGRAKPAARFAKALGIEVAAAQKDRIDDHHVEIGSGIDRLVKGYHKAIIYDDEIVTGTTVMELTRALIAQGISSIRVVCTHGVFAGESLAQLSAIPEINEIITTDTAAIPLHQRNNKLTVLSVAPVFGEAIWRNNNRQSIGDLFSFGEEPD